MLKLFCLIRRCTSGTNKADLYSSWHGSELEAATNRFLFIALNSRDPEKESTTSSIIPVDTKSKDKGKGIMQKAKEDPDVQRYQVMKRKPQTEAQARKNMIMYLKNVADFRLDYFKGMSYDDIRSIFEVKFNSNVDLLLKTKEHMEEKESRALHIINETPTQKAAKRRKLNKEVEDLKRHLEIVPDEDDNVYTEATPLARKNFNREDLEALWNLVKERFSTSKPKNVSNDFLLTTLEALFEKPDAQAQVWKNQRTIHGQAKVKSWKLLESYGVHIITFSTTQLLLLVERRYPLSRFTLDQMLNAVRLRVEEESEMSLELLSFGVDAAMDLKEKHSKCLMMLILHKLKVKQSFLLVVLDLIQGSGSGHIKIPSVSSVDCEMVSESKNTEAQTACFDYYNDNGSVLGSEDMKTLSVSFADCDMGSENKKTKVQVACSDD
uniref:Uncharacterized protein n=1 Tax=Tanacetum cinerariifolium TaxID=118510 RepID=A0A699JBT5_TANCI|nr:hypothetical protein [Tanacetum cinerariifolium]